METRNWTHCLLGSTLFLGAIGAHAAPVTYTLQTVGDGELGSHPFAQALITIVLESDTSKVEATPSAAGSGTLFVNKAGKARVTIVQNGKPVVANFERGEIYVFYDTGTGIAGFGSAISPTYPVALDCSNNVTGTPSTVDCQVGNAFNYERNGTLSGLFLSYAAVFTPELLALPQTLGQSTLLTGSAHMCALTYTIGNSANTFGDQGNLGICSGPAQSGLKTDHGGFYLQDMVGGSTSNVGPFGWGGWDTSNVGYLTVSVLPSDIDD